MTFGASSAQALVVFTNANIGRSVTVTYEGRISSGGGQVATDKLGATTIYKLKSVSADLKRWEFSYTITNTSTVGASSLMAVGFDATPQSSSLSNVISDGKFSHYIHNGQFPVAFGRVDVCLSANTGCTGGNPNNALPNSGTNSAAGTFFMDFANNPVQLTLDHFVTRFQAIAPSILGNNSGIAVQKTIVVTDPIVPGGVPEPAQWMLLIGGFGAVGATMRRRRSPIAA